MNAVELMEAVQRIRDPDQAIALMMEGNQEAGRQAHRELNRYVHNFVSSALTLVEHTRVFMRKHYAGLELLTTYEEQAKASFAGSAVAQFVQGLRNYMLHRGLPNSSMFMHFTANPDAKDSSGTAQTGVRYDTASLLNWKDWKPVARIYLEKAGEYLDLHEFAQEYLTLVNQFHGWLDATLAAHHQADLQELEQIRAQLQSIDSTRRTSFTAPAEQPDSDAVDPFEFTPMQETEIDRISSALLGNIRELHFQKIPKGFETERPITTVTDREIVGPITFWGKEVGGEDAFMFIRQEEKSYGLRESDYEALDGLIDAVMKSNWARAGLSREFVEQAFCEWARERFFTAGEFFPKALSVAARGSLKKIEVWAPIANMEVEQGFDFGPVRVESITATAMEDLLRRVPSTRPEQEKQVNQLFERLRREFQGYAVVVVSIEAEPIAAQKRALQIAQDAVSLLRFFSPAASRSFMFSPVALMGADYIPTSKLIVLPEKGFILSEGTLPRSVGYWRLSTQQVSVLKSDLLDVAASLVVPESLSDFALSVRASLMTYSKGTTAADPLDRLRSCVFSLESILLRHEMEPRAHSVSNRMSFLLAHGETDRDAIKQTVRQIYWLQEQPQLTAQSRREDALLTVFESYTYDVLRLALKNSPNFHSKNQFVMEVDRVGLST
ncbi:hypothetical protein SAMN03159363_1820 [Variovorax sp. EL159]|nr:hypothetical protein SAMN03159363_1820 [Variovorax sp. EL159]